MAVKIRTLWSSLWAYPGASTVNALASMCLSASAVFILMDPNDCGLGNAFLLYLGTPLLAMAGFFAGWLGGAASMYRWTRKRRVEGAVVPWSVLTVVCSVLCGWAVLFALVVSISWLF